MFCLCLCIFHLVSFCRNQWFLLIFFDFPKGIPIADINDLCCVWLIFLMEPLCRNHWFLLIFVDFHKGSTFACSLHFLCISYIFSEFQWNCKDFFDFYKGTPLQLHWISAKPPHCICCCIFFVFSHIFIDFQWNFKDLYWFL